MRTGVLLVEAIWAAQRSGMFFAVVDPSLSGSDFEHVMRRSGAKAIVLDSATVSRAKSISVADWAPQLRLFVGPPPAGFVDIDSLLSGCSDTPPTPELEGAELVFSSGTTGRPKGVRGVLASTPVGVGMSPLIEIMKYKYGFGSDNVYLATAPLHHSGSLRYLLLGGRVGLSAVVVRKFDAESVLRTIEKFGVTHTQLVPTMMVRIMKLPTEVRERYDLSSLKFVFHSGAPCPPDTKRAMLDWLGPIVFEGYAASEGPVVVVCSPQEWLDRPGTVGRPLFGEVHICDGDGHELPARSVGTVWFSGGAPFEYLDDPDSTARSRDHRGWSTVADLGFVDEDGYLFLRGREDGMAIVNGVNVYPLDAEHALVRHPDVLDVAVTIESDEDSGQKLRAFVQLSPAARPNARAVVAALHAHCRRELGSLQRPSAIDVVEYLPRDEAGKLRMRSFVPPTEVSDIEVRRTTEKENR